MTVFKKVVGIALLMVVLPVGASAQQPGVLVFGRDPATGDNHVVKTTSDGSVVVSGGAGGGGAATTDPDDASIAVSQTNDNANSLSMVYDGSVWRRQTVGTAGTAAAQVSTIQGIASMTPVLVTAQAGTALIGSVVTFPGTLVKGAVTSAMTGTTSTSVVSGTASNYLYITQCTTSNASTTVSTDILLQDGSGGTTLYVLPAPAAAVATTGGGGGAFTFPTPIKVDTSGNALYAANVTTGSSTKISCSGYRSTVSY